MVGNVAEGASSVQEWKPGLEVPGDQVFAVILADAVRGAITAGSIFPTCKVFKTNPPTRRPNFRRERTVGNYAERSAQVGSFVSGYTGSAATAEEYKEFHIGSSSTVFNRYRKTSYRVSDFQVVLSFEQECLENRWLVGRNDRNSDPRHT